MVDGAMDQLVIIFYGVCTNKALNISCPHLTLRNVSLQSNAVIDTSLKQLKHYYIRPHFHPLSRVSHVIIPFISSIGSRLRIFTTNVLTHYCSKSPKLHISSCIWLSLLSVLKSYVAHKLASQSRPCVYLSFSIQYHAHLCFEPI